MTTEQRIKLVYESTGLTQKEFAARLGLTQQTVSYVLNGERKAGEKFLTGIMENFKDVNPKWLMTGIGEMKSDSNEFNIIPRDVTEQLANKSGNVFELQNGKFRIFVKKVPVKAFGSYLSDYQDPDFFESLEEVEFTATHLGRGNYICFEVKGDSMNGGHIDDTKDGAELLCRELGRQHWKDGFRDSPLGWVIVHKDTIVFKDIKDVNMETGEAVLSSRSGLPQHPDFTINLNDVRQIWKVIKRTQD